MPSRHVGSEIETDTTIEAAKGEAVNATGECRARVRIRKSSPVLRALRQGQEGPALLAHARVPAVGQHAGALAVEAFVHLSGAERIARSGQSSPG
jgi:hypothetical protein